MKKLILSALALLLCFTFCSCSNANQDLVPSAANTSNTSSVQPTPIDSNEAMSYDFALAERIKNWKDGINDSDVEFLKAFISATYNFDLTKSVEGKHLSTVVRMFEDIYNSKFYSVDDQVLKDHFKQYNKSYESLSKLDKMGFTEYSLKKLLKIKKKFEEYK